MMESTQTKACRLQRGVTLIELMVAMLISSILLIGALTVFSDSRRTFRTSDIIARLQESARFALDTIEPDIRQAAYWGLANGYTPIEGTANADNPVPPGMDVTGDCGQNFALDLNTAVQGSDNGFDYTCRAYGAGSVADSDVITVRHASRETAAPEAGRLQIQSNREKVRVFVDGAMPPGFVAAPESQTHNLVVNSYYLSQDSVLGAGVSSLRRKRLAPGPSMIDEEIIPHVQDFQAQLGADTTGDGAANKYVHPGNLPAGAVVVAVRVWLLFRAHQIDGSYTDARTYRYAGRQLGPFNDNFHRLLVSKTIQLRNTRF